MVTIIKKSNDLVTTKDSTRDGFINIVKKKNEYVKPYMDSAKEIYQILQKTDNIDEIIENDNLKEILTDAAGLSVKSRKFFSKDDIDIFIKDFINQLKLNPDSFKEEIIFRYLLTKGDALGGKIRNVIGNIAEDKFVSFLTKSLKSHKIKFKFQRRNKNVWEHSNKKSSNDFTKVKSIVWKYKKKFRTLYFNLTIPIVKKNIDISIFNKDFSNSKNDIEKIKKKADNYVCLGELKGGIDPAGADEHWKTANTSLNRIRKAFNGLGSKINTVFIGAAIEESMSKEIFNLYKKGELSNCANLTNDNQVKALCDWIVKL